MTKNLVVALGLLCVLSAGAHAGERNWKEKHPRRAEVNGRLKNQDKRIHDGVEDGQLDKKQAAQLHKEDRRIRREERRMAAKDGGHITKGEQAKLNRQENRVSRQIYNERHEGQGVQNGQGQSGQPAAAPTTGQ